MHAFAVLRGVRAGTPAIGVRAADSSINSGQQQPPPNPANLSGEPGPNQQSYQPYPRPLTKQPRSGSEAVGQASQSGPCTTPADHEDRTTSLCSGASVVACLLPRRHKGKKPTHTLSLMTEKLHHQQKRASSGRNDGIIGDGKGPKPSLSRTARSVACGCGRGLQRTNDNPLDDGGGPKPRFLSRPVRSSEESL